MFQQQRVGQSYLKNIFFMITLSPFFVSAGDARGLSSNFEIQSKIEKNFCGRFGSHISKYLDWSLMRPNDLKQKNFFVGESLSTYNPSDYYIWVDAYDINNNGKDDLVAIDWHKRNKTSFYLAYYVFFDMGEIVGQRHDLKKFFLNKKLKKRHGTGYVPWFPEYILVEEEGVEIDYSFVGFHEIKPVLFEGKVFVVAKKENESTKKIMVFSFDSYENKINLVCNF